MNQVWLQGRLASDPEGGESGQGVSYAMFPLAVEKGSGDNKSVLYFDCVVFRQTADFARQYLHKGDAVNLIGSVNIRDWTDANGVKHRKYEVTANQVSFPVSGKRRADSGNSRSQGSPRNGRAPAPAAVGGGYTPEPPDYDY